jgi:hypothetical protein
MKLIKLTFSAATLAALTAISLFGCGGGGTPNLTTTPTPGPTPAPDTVSVSLSPLNVLIDKGGSAVFTTTVLGTPLNNLRYHYVIAAPTAVLIEQTGAGKTGADIEITDKSVKLQTGAADFGRLNLRVEVLRVATDGTKTKIGESSATIDIPDVRPLDITVGTERTVAREPRFVPLEKDFKIFEFDFVPGAKRYIITFKNSLTGATTERYRMLISDVDATPATDIPFTIPIDPNNPQVSNPPYIPVAEEIRGVVAENFWRRGNGIRVGVADGSPIVISVNVYF